MHPTSSTARRAALYVRVSTAAKARNGAEPIFEQNPAVQELPLRQLAEQRGWTVVQVFSDRASGAKERRQGLEALMREARRGTFDVVVVWRFDRFARSVKQLVLALEEFRTLGVDFISHQEALDTGTPMGRAMFTIIAALAELERSVIRERVMAGVEYARERGTKSGRPIGRPRRVFDREAVVRLAKEGHTIRQIARETGLGAGTVARAVKAAKAGSSASQKPAA